MNISKAIRSAFKHHQEGNFQQAENMYRKILKNQTNHFDALHMLGVLCSQLGNHDLAIHYIGKALRIKPESFQAHYNLGNVFKTMGQNDKAISCYQSSLQINLHFIDSYLKLGELFQKEGQIDKAIVCYHKIIQLNPNIAEAYHNIGNILVQKGQIDEAIHCYQKVLQINPDIAETYNSLGVAFKEKGRLDEAITYYQKAVKLNPDFANAYFNLGNAFRKVGKLKEAIDAYDMAAFIKPNNIKAYWAKCMSQLPIIYPDQSSIESARNNYQNELLKLRDTISLEAQQDIEAAAEAIGSQQPFYLAYQGLNDLELQQIYGNLVHRIMASRYPHFTTSPVMPPWSTGTPLRIGMVSGHFYHHTVWKLFKGWVEHLDKKRFSLYGYYTGHIKDHLTEVARQHCMRFVEDVYSFKDLCRIIRNDNLHVLIYTEIGMDPVTIKLAALRLSPVQCVSWGHPDTSGLPTIDYFLSSDLMEPPDANTHYSELLTRLPNISVYYEPMDVHVAQISRNTFGLHEQSILYLCCQSLFKYLPQYDEVFPHIAQRVSDCQFLFISHKSNFVTERFCSRIKKAFHQFGMNSDDYVVFLPRLDTGQYFAINQLSDIYLDSFGWSGGNTTLEAITCNLPVVTLPGTLMRSRHTAAILTMMGLTETIAPTVDDYVNIAAGLGRDPEWRRHISEKIHINKSRVYCDSTCITALEDFLERAVSEKPG